MKKITIETFEEYKFLSEPSISPNGEYTAFVVQTMNIDKNSYSGNIHIVNNSTNESMELTSLGDAKSFVWTKDNKILFSALRDPKHKKMVEAGEEITAYYEISPKGGEAKLAFTVPLKVNKIIALDDYSFALVALFDNSRPDLSILDPTDRSAALEKIKNKTHVVFDELPFWSNGRGIINKKRNRGYIFNPKNQELKPLTAPLFELNNITVSDKYIMYSGVEFDTVKPTRPGVYLYNMADGSTKELIKPLSAQVGIFALMGESAIICLSDGKKYGVNQFPYFYSLCLATGELKLLAENDGSVGSSSVGSDSRLGGGQSYKVCGDKLYYSTTELNYSYLRSIDLKGNISKNLTNDGSVDSFDINNGKIMFVGMRGTGLAELYCLCDGKEVQISNLNHHIQNSYSVIKPQAMSYVGSDGEEIYGWVMKPLGYKEGNKYPAILNIHGGPRSVFSDVFFHEMQVWANDGYFVFYSNPRGSDGRGNEFGDINGKYGTVDYVNVMEFTDKVLELYPDIDTSKLGVTGGSYGGYMTNWIIGHTNRFAAACAQRSISNWITYEGTSDIGYYFTEDMLSATTHTDLEAVWDASPIKYAMNAVTPTLYVQSEQDYRCWMGDSLQMFNHLKKRGIDSKYVLFYGDNHELSRSGTPKNRVTRLEEIGKWFNNYLK